MAGNDRGELVVRVRVTIPDAELRSELKARVTRARAEKLSGGFEFDGHRYDTDPQSLLNLTAAVAAVAAGIPLPNGFAWRSADNINVPHNAESLLSLSAAVLEFTSAVYAKSWELKDRIETDESPQLVDARGGWPEPRQGKKTK